MFACMYSKKLVWSLYAIIIFVPSKVQGPAVENHWTTLDNELSLFLSLLAAFPTQYMKKNYTTSRMGHSSCKAWMHVCSGPP